MNDENDQYLWDKTGEPDAFIAGLERDLAPLAMKAPPVAPAVPREAVTRPTPVARLGWGAVAAAVLAVAGAAWVAMWSLPRSSTTGVAEQPVAMWTVWRSTIGGGKVGATVRGGERITAAPGEYAAMESGEAFFTVTGGAVTLGTRPGEIRVETGKVKVQGVAMAEAGSVTVRVDHRAAAVTLEMGERWTALLRVDDGVAEMRGATRFARVPAGFESRVEKGEPGLPLRPDAGKGLAYAVTMLEDARGGMKGMFVIVEEAKVEDAPTLWNAAWRRDGEMRKVVLTKLDELVPAPDRKMLDVWSEEGMEAWWRKIAQEHGRGP